MKKIILGILVALMVVGCLDEDNLVPNPKIYFANDGKFEVEVDTVLKLSPKIIYDRNSTYKWFRDGEEIWDSLEYKFKPETLKDYTLRFTVNNQFGGDTFDISIMVREMLDFTKIDNVTTKKNAHELVMVPNENVNYLSVGNHQFYNIINSDTTLWGGFAYCSKTSVQNKADKAALGCAFITPEVTTSQYLTVSGFADPVITFRERFVVRSIDVANENFLAVISKFGTPDYPLYERGDYLKVRFYGIVDDVFSGKYIEHTLMDCDFDNKAKYFRQNTWETIDLRELGAVDGLYIQIFSSVDNYPLFCCIDNIRLQKE